MEKKATKDDYIRAIRALDQWHEKTGRHMLVVESYVDQLEAANRAWAEITERSGLQIVIDQVTGQTFLMRVHPHVVLSD